MEIVIVVIAVLAYMAYSNKQSSEEKISLIREMSVAIKSTNVTEYKESIPEFNDEYIETIQDELVQIDDIEPEQLLRALK